MANNMMRRSILVAGASAMAAPLIRLTTSRAMAQTATSDTHKYFVFSNSLPGQDAEFNGWYDTRHIRDVLQITGFTAAQRFRLNDVQLSGGPSTYRYMIVFDMQTNAPVDSIKELQARLKSGVVQRGPAFDYSDVDTFLAHSITPRMTSAELYPDEPQPVSKPGGAPLGKYTLLVFSNAVSGREDEYNNWYNTQHVPDVIHAPGFIAGQRFQVSDPSYMGKRAAKYMVYFEVESADLPACYATVHDNIKTGKTRWNTSYDSKTTTNSTFIAITDKLTLPTLPMTVVQDATKRG